MMRYQKRTFSFLDKTLLDEYTEDFLSQKMFVLLTSWINNDNNTYKSMFKYSIAEHNTVSWNNTVESVVWSGFIEFIRYNEYKGENVNKTTLSNHLKKWLDTYSESYISNYSNSLSYLLLDSIYDYYYIKRKERKIEILKQYQ